MSRQGQPRLASDPGSESLRWASNALGNVIATLGGHRLGNESDERLGLATIVPFDAGQPANRTTTRLPPALGLFLAWQFTTDRPAELLAGYRIAV
ncbi:MAG: hypothetical protein ACK5PB_15350 [Pirellula sp.]